MDLKNYELTATNAFCTQKHFQREKILFDFSDYHGDFLCTIYRNTSYHYP